jgi:hypothetical protein
MQIYIVTRSTLKQDNFTSLQFPFNPQLKPLCLYCFSDPLSKSVNLQGKDASTPADKRFPSFMVLFTEEYLRTSVLCFLLLIFLHDRLYTGSVVSAGYPLSLSKPVSRCVPCNGRTIGLSVYTVPKFPNPIHLYDLQI